MFSGKLIRPLLRYVKPFQFRGFSKADAVAVQTTDGLDTTQNSVKSHETTGKIKRTQEQEEYGQGAVCDKPQTQHPTDLDLKTMDDSKLVELIHAGKIPHYNLERQLHDTHRAVRIRRTYIEQMLEKDINKKINTLESLPHKHFNFDEILDRNCENVIGYVSIPVGVAGPLLLDNVKYMVPMATTEGCLIASTHRGMRAIALSGGCTSVLMDDGMTRAPVVEMPLASDCQSVVQWLAQDNNYKLVKTAFDSTSDYARLTEIKPKIAGRKLYLKFRCTSGDAMGMNMITKGVTKAMDVLFEHFPQMVLLSVSGNYCTDKKPSAVNWIDGRGKYVICEAIIHKDVVQKVLKITVDRLVDLNISKNLIGSAMAGSIGGFNAHASNPVTAVFIATGQDCAQNVESSNCITIMERTTEGDLYISVTMPSIEVGTVGGGTRLPAQRACLNMLGISGPHEKQPGQNAAQLARIIAGTVLASELSLMSALAAGHLLASHMRLNRGSQPRNPPA